MKNITIEDIKPVLIDEGVVITVADKCECSMRVARHAIAELIGCDESRVLVYSDDAPHIDDEE